MEQITLDELQKIGVDTEGAMERFLNNIAFYEKMLIKFKKDPNYECVMKAFEQKDYETAKTKVHALKGVCANLGINTIYKVTANMMEELRNGNFEAAESRLPKLSNDYRSIMDVLKSI